MENYIIRSKARRQLKDRMGLAVRTILLSTILLNIVNVMLDITDDNILPFIQIGGKIIYKESDILTVLEQNYIAKGKHCL